MVRRLSARSRITLRCDFKIREFLKKKLKEASVSKILIERPARKAHITIHTARPGVVIGKKGEDIESLRTQVAKLLKMPVNDVRINIAEIRKPELDAQLVAEGIAQQLERRVMFRRAMKRSVQNTMRLGAQGIKVQVAGRLNGGEIARTEWYAGRARAPAYLPRRYRLCPGRSDDHLWRHRRKGLDFPWRSVRSAGSRRRKKRQLRPRRRVKELTSMLQPKRTKFRKQFKGRNRGLAQRGNTVAFGEYGLKATDRCRLTARQIEAARRAMTRYVKRGGKVWIRIFPDKPITAKPLEVRQGSGKGNVEF